MKYLKYNNIYVNNLIENLLIISNNNIDKEWQTKR